MSYIGEVRPAIVIPARLGSTRLPRKPLADLHGEPMIVHVWRRATEAALGPALVACDDAEIAAAVRTAGGDAELTGGRHASGSDRVFEAIEHRDPGGAHDIVVNLQGDLPHIDPEALRAVLTPLERADVDIATLAGPLDSASREDPAAVKVRVEVRPGQRVGRALGFSRTYEAVPTGVRCCHHIGVYAYRRDALARFVALEPTDSERSERLEQLRALEAGFVIEVALVDSIPLAIDTPDDLARARRAPR